MKHRSNFRALAVGLALGLGVLALAASEPMPAGPPPGAAEFAARVARDHRGLVRPEEREAWGELNRDLRQAQQQLRQAATEGERAGAADRLASASKRLEALARACPRRIPIDLTGPQPSLRELGSHEVSGSRGGLLFEVVTGTNGPTYVTSVMDFTQVPEFTLPATIPVSADGTNHVLLSLEHIPAPRASFMFELRRGGEVSPVRLSLTLVTPEPGRLKLEVVEERTGRAVPAMVQLWSEESGLVRPPGNGIEFAPQFESLGSPTGARQANLPGPLNGAFWCVPGPVDMPIDPGAWRIGIRRGVEFEPLFVPVTVRSRQTVTLRLQPRRWVDMRRRGWWSGDDHVHNRLVSDEDAQRLMAWVKAEDIHLANVVKMGDLYRTYFEQRGFGRAFRVVDGEFVLVPGQECPRTHDQIGHTLAMNITEMVRNPDRYFLYDEVFDAVHAQGGLSGYAHGNAGLFHVHRDMSLNVPREKVDFVEILQFNQLGTGLYYEFLNLGCKLTASAGSDVPWGGTIGEVRAYAYLGRERFSADAWFAAFGRGRTFTTSGPMLEFTVEDALPGDEVRLRTDRPLRVRAKAWGAPGRMAPLRLEVVRLGDVVRTADSPDARRPEARLDFTVPAGHGCWIAARARAGDGTSAHTTPVYVLREGFRFWKFTDLDDLLARRQASLVEIERLVAEARESRTDVPPDQAAARDQLRRQGDALLERVELARRVYAGLRETAARERAAGRTQD